MHRLCFLDLIIRRVQSLTAIKGGKYVMSSNVGRTTGP